MAKTTWAEANEQRLEAGLVELESLEPGSDTYRRTLNSLRLALHPDKAPDGEKDTANQLMLKLNDFVEKKAAPPVVAPTPSSYS